MWIGFWLKIRDYCIFWAFLVKYMHMEKAYEPNLYEDKIYKLWEESGFFNPDVCVQKGVTKKNAKPFSIVLPPPNATGSLHIGHAMMLAIEDVMIRYHRMKGDKTLWIPGTDHAAIATNAVVEKLLAKEGKTKQDLGREAYVQKVKDYIKNSQDNIRNQVRKMGASLDWSREAYTWDEERNLAVRTMFKKMYDDGLIYRGYRIVNWCPHCHSTLADDEVIYKEQKTKFYYFKFGPVIIGTARPETKFLDKTIIVHPDDPRYKDIVGKEFDMEWIDGRIKCNVIADPVSDPKFGTGAMTITPAHCFEDYELAKKYNLPIVQIIDEDGNFTKVAGKFAGKNAQESREAIVKILADKGLVDHIDENYTHNLSVCYRCKNAIEPLPSKQWFVDVNKKFKIKNSRLKTIEDGQTVTLKKLMQTVVKSRQIEIIPERFDKTYFHWVDNLRDWCISRQIWVGHQIPVWHKSAKKGVKITFVRHGETEAHVNHLAPGQLDTPLTEEGKKHALSLKEKLNDDFAVVFSSDLNRAIETTKIIFGDKKFKTDIRLREIDYGKLSGGSVEEVNKDRMQAYPNGESYLDVKNRVNLFLADLIEEYDGKHVVIVAHSGVRKVLDVILDNQELNNEHLVSSTTFEPVKYELKDLIYVGTDAPVGTGWLQDPDNLDTWFSSGLWTFSTLGWPASTAKRGEPNKTKDLEIYHPTSVLETMFDILFFWVARMIMMSTYALGEIPFEKVYLHARVLDKDGEKMSKSKPETMIDPLDVCKKYGTDAVRLSLLIGVAPGTDVRMSTEKIEGFRNFANKLWNIARFIESQKSIKFIKSVKAKTLSDKWILSRLNETIKIVTENIEKFNFSYAGEVLRDFTWGELADWYLEIAKIEGQKDEILNYILETILKLWHPFMPFVTETIWANTKHGTRNMGHDMLMVSGWPSVIARRPKADAAIQFELLRDIITGIRSLRADYKIDPVKKLKVVISAGSKEKLLEENQKVIIGLARLEDCKILPTQGRDPASRREKIAESVGFVVGEVEVFVDLSGVVDLGKEKARLKSEIENLEKYLNGLEMKFGNESFVKNAPKEVVEKEKAKMIETKEKLEKLSNQLKSI